MGIKLEIILYEKFIRLHFYKKPVLKELTSRYKLTADVQAKGTEKITELRFS